VQREQANPFDSEFADMMPAQIYQGMVGDLTREGNRQAGLAVLERIYNIVADAGPSASKQYLLFTLTAAQANLGELQAALNTTLKMETGEKRDNALFLIALERTRHGDPSGAFDLALGLSDELWRNSSLSGIAEAQAASGDYVSALSTVDQIRGAGEHANGLSELAVDQAEKNDPAAGLTAQLAWEAALHAGNETKPDVFAKIAVARGMTGDIAGALDILGRMAPNDRFWAIQSLTEILVHAGRKTEAIALAESQDQAYPKACAYLGVASQLFEEQKEAAGRRPGL